MTAVRHARLAFDQGRDLGFDMSILDIGGGFQDTNFEPMASSLRRALENEFPEDIHIIAEPGRFYARSFYTLACKVISRRKNISTDGSSRIDMLYQNDGIYGCFMNRLIEEEEFKPTLVSTERDRGNPRTAGKHSYSIWGPTCDSVDCVADQATMDCEVRVGDWLKYSNMGGKLLCALSTDQPTRPELSLN